MTTAEAVRAAVAGVLLGVAFFAVLAALPWVAAAVMR